VEAELAWRSGQRGSEGLPHRERIGRTVEADAFRQGGTERMEAELQGRDDPEVRAGPAYRPEQVRMVRLARSHVRAVSGHELDGRQGVEGQAAAPLEPADAPAECQAGDAGVPDGPDGADETMRLGSAVEFAEMRPAIRASAAGVRVDRGHAHHRQAV